MKKLIGALLTVFALDASAFTGDGNTTVEYARAYMEAINDDSFYAPAAVWHGMVVGASDVYSDSSHLFAICYPKEATSDQLVEIAARYVIENPEIRAKPTRFLIHEAHYKAFSLQSSESCWLNEKWKFLHQ